MSHVGNGMSLYVYSYSPKFHEQQHPTGLADLVSSLYPIHVRIALFYEEYMRSSELLEDN